MSQQLSTNTFGVAKWIVSSTASDGTHTTIAAAIASASSGDDIFIRPGTYTENLTLKAGVNLTTFTGDAQVGTVVIVGKCTLTAGGVAISNISLQTNSDFAVVVSGSSLAALILNNCYINCANNTGISFTSSSASSFISMYNCLFNLGTTGIAFFASTSAGPIQFFYCNMQNGGGSTTASTCTTAVCLFDYCQVNAPITTSSTCTLFGKCTQFNTAAQNAICITHGGSVSSSLDGCKLASGTNSAVTISTTLIMSLCTVVSANTNAITGAGTLVNGGISFTSGLSYKINTSTQSARQFDVGGISFDGGTTLLDTLPVPLNVGGTNAALTASNGGIFYSTATAGAILSGTATAGQLLQSGSSTTPAWTTSTYPATNAVSTLLYASAANVMSALATVNRASLSTNSTGVPTWLAMTNGQMIIGSTAGSPAAGTITSTGGTITVTAGSNTLNLEVATGGLSWTDVTTSTQALAVENGYITDRAGGVTYTLPATASLGDEIIILGKSGIAVITPNANQQILIGSTSGTVGVTGTATANNAGDCLTLRCITSGSSTVWRSQAVVGTWTLA